MDYKKLPTENEEQYIWRLGQAKDSGLIDMDWSDIAKIINEQCRDDETEYRTEAAYRKPYQMAKRFYESGVFGSYTADDSYINELYRAKEELAKEKVKISDERTVYNRIIRAQARNEANLEYLEKLIKDRSSAVILPFDTIPNRSGANDLIICVSDLHLGETVDNAFGTYNSKIAKERLGKYLEEIKSIANKHDSENAYVLLLGDQISGNIHQTIQLENRENVIEQVQSCAEMLSGFIYRLSEIFKNVYINSVAGNHSRLSLKDMVLREERLDNLIPWYIKASLSHISNVHFLVNIYNDSTISAIEIRNNIYIAVHGDFDKFNESGVSKLVLMLGYKPEAIFYGHLHHNSFDEISDIKIIRSGSLSGTGSDYCVSKRISGSPSQMVVVVNGEGVKTLYPISLK